MRPEDLGAAETIDKEHGLLEVRRAEVRAEIVAHLGWPGAVQVVRGERTREIKGTASIEIPYFVTSLPKADADPARLLVLARSHRAIENKLHWRRDVSMNEDRFRGRAGARPPVRKPAQPRTRYDPQDRPLDHASRRLPPAQPSPPTAPQP